MIVGWYTYIIKYIHAHLSRLGVSIYSLSVIL